MLKLLVGSLVISSAAASCVTPSDGKEGADLLETSMAGGNWQQQLTQAFHCMVPHEFTAGKYSFDDKSRLMGRDTKRECTVLRDAVREVTRRWIARDIPNRKTYVSDYTSTWSTFELYVLPSVTGDKKASREVFGPLSTVRRACEEKHGEPHMSSSELKRKGLLDMDLPPWLENDYARWKHEQSKSGCQETLSLSAEQIIERIDASNDVEKIMSLLRCLVPHEPNTGREGGNVPLEGAKCDVFRTVVSRIAHRHINEHITTMMDAESMFRRDLESRGVKTVGSNLVELGAIVNACSLKRPYRDWGTTNRDIVDPFRVTLKVADDIPADDSSDSTHRVEMFCLQGIAGRQSGFHLRPGGSSSLSVGFDKWAQHEGLSCQLNRGLSSVRRYTIEGHKTICVSSNLFLRRMSPSLPYRVVVEPDSCPYAWTLDTEVSTPEHAVVVLKMKSQAERDGGSLEETEGKECPAVRALGEEDLAGRIEAAVTGAEKSNEEKGQALLGIVRCAVPIKRVGNLKRRRREVAKCDLLVNAMARVIYKTIGGDGSRPGPSGDPVSSVSDPLGALENLFAVRDPGVEIRSIFDTCREPVPEELWGHNTHIYKGELWAVRSIIEPGTVPEDSTLARKSGELPHHCLHGVQVEQQGIARQRFNLPKRRGFVHLGAHKFDGNEGFSCGMPLVQDNGCLLAATLMKFGDQPWFITTEDHDRGDRCPLKWTLQQNAADRTVIIRLTRK